MQEEERPNCKRCDRPLRVYRFRTKHHRWGASGDNFFCDSHCAYWFAVEYWRAREPDRYGDRIAPEPLKKAQKSKGRSGKPHTSKTRKQRG